jgi:hypothetical protein
LLTGGGLRLDREAAGRAVHARADVLHALRHVGRDVRRAVRLERAHPQALLGHARCLVEIAPREGEVDLLQRLQVVAHVGDGVDAHGLRKDDELARITRAHRGRFVRVLGRGRRQIAREAEYRECREECPWEFHAASGGVEPPAFSRQAPAES